MFKGSLHVIWHAENDQKSMVTPSCRSQSLDKKSMDLFSSTTFWVLCSIIREKCFVRGHSDANLFTDCSLNKAESNAAMRNALCWASGFAMVTDVCCSAIHIYFLMHSLMVSQSECGSFYLFCASLGRFSNGTSADFHLLMHFFVADKRVERTLGVAVLSMSCPTTLWLLIPFAPDLHCDLCCMNGPRLFRHRCHSSQQSSVWPDPMESNLVTRNAL